MLEPKGSHVGGEGLQPGRLTRGRTSLEKDSCMDPCLGAGPVVGVREGPGLVGAQGFVRE